MRLIEIEVEKPELGYNFRMGILGEKFSVSIFFEYFYICYERVIMKPSCTGKHGFMKSTCLRMSV